MSSSVAAAPVPDIIIRLSMALRSQTSAMVLARPGPSPLVGPCGFARPLFKVRCGAGTGSLVQARGKVTSSFTRPRPRFSAFHLAHVQISRSVDHIMLLCEVPVICQPASASCATSPIPRIPADVGHTAKAELTGRREPTTSVCESSQGLLAPHSRTPTGSEAHMRDFSNLFSDLAVTPVEQAHTPDWNCPCKLRIGALRLFVVVWHMLYASFTFT